MITIEFKINENELIENLDNELEKLDNCFFVLTLFMMPVRIQIENINIFDPPDPWAEMPIMNIASNGLLHIKALKLGKSERYELPEAVGIFEFTLLGANDVIVIFDNLLKPVTFIVRYSELLESFQKFADKVRKFLWERVPQMNEHPYWGPWLRGERD